MDLDTSDVQKQIEMFKSTFDSADPKEHEKAVIIIDYIIRQLNNESLKGHLDYYQYTSLVMHAVRGLFKLIYLDFFAFEKDEDRLHRLVRSDVIYNSSYNLMMMLFTRVYLGRDRDLILKMLEAQRPIAISTQK